jgi:hypothetical protein
MGSGWRARAVVGVAIMFTFAVPLRSSAASLNVTATTYAASLLTTAPIPKVAHVVEHLPQKLEDAFGMEVNPDSVQLHRYFVLQRGINLRNFLRAHLPEGYSVGAGLSNDTAGMYGTGYELSPACTDRHVASCTLGYTVGTFDNGVRELRIDVLVVWVPVHVAQLPTTGVVTVTAYDELSLANPPTHPVTVVLGFAQASRLGAVLANLRNEPGGGLCAEDTPVYRIDAAPYPGALVTWSAIDHSCDGVLEVIRQQGNVAFALNGNACAIQHLVASFLPPGEARASRELLKPCSK